MTETEAETVGLTALAWLVGHDELVRVFMGSTGASEQDLRMGAANLEFLGSVLDFLLLDDAWISAFAAETGIAPEAPLAARQALPGGNLPQWT
ncbi:MAG: DUF3572 domain-containing protein [Pseudomonadota bacterium]